MSDDDLDRRSRTEAALIRAEAAAVARTEDALAALHQPVAHVVTANRRRPRRMNIAVPAGGMAAALAVVVAVAVVAERDSSPRPPASVPVPPATIVVSTTPTSSSPESTSATSAPSTSTQLTAPMDPTTVDMFAGWPAAPTGTPALNDVPRLLTEVPGATRMEAGEGVSEWGPYTLYVQEFIAPTVPVTTLTVSTRPYPYIVAARGESITVPGWDDARSGENALPERVSVSLIEPTGSVTINSIGLSTLEVSAIARDLVRRPDGPGWQMTLPNAPSVASMLVPTGDGWTDGFASRHSRWYDDADQLVAELDVTRGGGPGLGDYSGFGGGTLSITDINGAMAVVEEVYPGGTRVTWSPGPGLRVRFGVLASIDDALALARSLRSVDQARLDAATSPARNRGDGCQSLFC